MFEEWFGVPPKQNKMIDNGLHNKIDLVYILLLPDVTGAVCLQKSYFIKGLLLLCLPWYPLASRTESPISSSWSISEGVSPCFLVDKLWSKWPTGKKGTQKGQIGLYLK